MSDVFPVEISPEALAQLQRLLVRKGDAGSFLRIGVKGGGCSGFEYMFKIENDPREGDLVTHFGDLKVVCDPKSATFLTGAKIIWTGNLMSGGFGFENPNAARSCGCGTSFTPKDF